MSKERRTDNTATLSISGRDQPDQCLHLVRNEETLQWNFDHADTELYKEPPDPLLEKVAALVTEEHPTWQGSATELIAGLELELKAQRAGNAPQRPRGKAQKRLRNPLRERANSRGTKHHALKDFARGVTTVTAVTAKTRAAVF